MGSIIVAVTGTWTGTLSFTASLDGTNYFSWFGISNTTLGTIQSITSNDQVMFNAAGIQDFRVGSTATWTGIAIVSIVADQAASGLVSPATGNTTGAGAFPVSIQNGPVPVTTTLSSSSSSIQIVPIDFVDTNNQSTANLAASATFNGTTTNCAQYSAIEVFFKASQACTIQVFQSPDGTNFDITDTYTVAANTGDVRPFQPMGQSYKVSVTNNGGITTTFLRLHTTLSIVNNVLPRALTQAGALIVDGSAVTQPISAGTLPLPTLAATSTNQTNGTQQTQITDGTHLGTIKAASTAAVATDTALVVAISPNNSISTTAAINTNGSVTNSTTVGTTATTFTAPTNAVGFVVEAESSNSVNLRYACGTTATTTVGMLLEPGRDSGYIPSKGAVTVCAVSSSAQAASIQWVLSS